MMSEFRDAKEHLFRYLDAKQHLWNCYFRERVVDLTDPVLDRFEAIDHNLFEALVCHPLDIALPDGFIRGQDTVPRLEAVPISELNVIEGLVRKEGGGSTVRWERFSEPSSATIALAFIDFFQWDHYGFLSMGKVTLRVAAWPEAAWLVDREIILDHHDVVFRLRGETA